MTTTVAPVTTTIAQAIMDSSESWHDTEAGHHSSVAAYVVFWTFLIISLLFYVTPDAAWSNWSSEKVIPFCNGRAKARFYLRWWIQITFGFFGFVPLMFFIFEFLFCCVCCCTTTERAIYRFKMSTVLCNSKAIVAKADQVRNAAKVMPAGEQAIDIENQNNMGGQATNIEAAGTQVQIKKGQQIKLETVEGQTITLTTALRM